MRWVSIVLAVVCMTIAASALSQAAEPRPVVSLLGGKIKLLRPSDDHNTSQAVIVDSLSLAYTAQVLPLDTAGKIARPGNATWQAAAALKNLDGLLCANGSSLEQVVKLNLYVARQGDVADVRRAVAAAFERRMKPAVSMVITPLPHPDALVALDAVAATPQQGAAHSQGAPRVTLHAPGAPSFVAGPSALAVMPVGGQIYISGQAEEVTDLATATRKTLESLHATLKHLGRSASDVVQYKAFVQPMSASKVVYETFADVLGKDRVPPVVLVEWKSDLPIEIELVAWGGETDDTRDVEYVTPPGMTASPLFSRVARNYRPQAIYISGLYGTSGASGKAQVTEILDALGQLAAAGGSDLKHLLKGTYYVSDEDTSTQLGALRPRYYDPARPPAASKAMVHGVGRKGNSVAVDMIAAPAK